MKIYMLTKGCVIFLIISFGLYDNIHCFVWNCYGRRFMQGIPQSSLAGLVIMADPLIEVELDL